MNKLLNNVETVLNLKAVIGLTLTLGFLSGALQSAYALECNGNASHCQKRYNEMTYATTHNGQSHKKNMALLLVPGSNINNQNWSFEDQMKAGIRATKMPVHLQQGQTMACHGIEPRLKNDIKRWVCGKFWRLDWFCKDIVDDLKPCNLDPAAKAFVEHLVSIRDFLRNNPHEVFTLFIEDFSSDLENLKRLFDQVEVTQFLYRQDSHQLWPTLETLIQRDQRLIVFVNSAVDRKGYAVSNTLFNDTGYFVWSSPYTYRTVKSLRADDALSAQLASLSFRREDRSNKLFLLQHFITPAVGGHPTPAATVNEKSVLMERIQKYKGKLQIYPNFISVDFFELPKNKPGVFDVVHEINQAGR